MPPSWIATRCSAAPSGASSTASSPSTKAGTFFRKCAPTTGAPAATARVRSMTEGASRVSLTRRSSRAGGKTLADHLLGQLAADEHDPALALLVGAPRALMVAVENHVHALEHETVGIVLEREDTLGAQDAGSFLCHEVLHPREELIGVERPVGPERNRLHVFVVIMLEPVAVMAVVVSMRVVVAAVRMVMPVAVGGEEVRLDFDEAVEVEGLAAEHLRQRHLAALGAVQLG